MATLLSPPEGDPDDNYYLVSMDPGQGKTEAVCAFLNAWKEMGFQPEGGVLVAVSRLEEIKAYISRSGLADEDFAVLVGKGEDLNDRGRTERASAPILFTTHEMIRRRTSKESSFAKTDAFHFQGTARACRIWDEAMLPATPFTISVDALNGLLEPLRPRSREAASFIEEIVQLARSSRSDASIELPIAPMLPEHTLGGLEAAIRQRWDNLVALSGTKVLVSVCNLYGLQLSGTLNVLPDDFAPAVVLDASGRVRKTYDIWKETKGNLVRLPAVPIDYSRLAIHHWDRPASRSTFNDARTRAEVLQAVADLINAEPSEEWLIVHHKKKGKIDVCRELCALLDRDRSRVHFLHWGNHHGTNAFRQVRNVVILGLWNYGLAVNLAHAVAAQAGVADAYPEQAMVHAIEQGEHQHNLLQAVCRGAVRTGSGETCGDCRAYVIGRPSKDGGELLAETFPGAVIAPWVPVPQPLRGNARQLAVVLQEAFASSGVLSIPKKLITQAMGFTSPSALSQLLKRHDVLQWLEQNGIAMITRYFIRAAA